MKTQNDNADTPHQYPPFTNGDLADEFDISEQAVVFVDVHATSADSSECAICLQNVTVDTVFRFQRRVEESFTSGFKKLGADQRLFLTDLEWCSHAYHKACIKAYAEHSIIEEGRWKVKCPAAGCPLRLYTADVSAVVGAESRAFQLHAQLRSRDYTMRLEALKSGAEGADDATREWMKSRCCVCPSCSAVICKEDGCPTVTCTCEKRFEAAKHRGLLQ